MTIVQVGKLGRATLKSRTWSSAIEALARFLQVETELLFIHGGIPDVEEFIVMELARQWPLVVIEKTPEPEDPEAVDPGPDAELDDMTVY